MPTLRQKRVAKKKVEALGMDNPPTSGEILENIGYSEGIVKNPKVVMESEGVKEALRELGFNEDNAKKVVGDILDDKEIEPNTRINAAREIFKVHGSYAAEKHVNVNVEATPSESIMELAKVLLDEQTNTSRTHTSE